ncbi:hypothetical protein [Fibrella arboris]|uniref:Ig-like domain-containing protein n=1 Tax=Fibrella arboris TaxID=3242486 RepID=UPI003522CFA7
MDYFSVVSESSKFSFSPGAALVISGTPFVQAGMGGSVQLTFSGVPPFTFEYNNYTLQDIANNYAPRSGSSQSTTQYLSIVVPLTNQIPFPYDNKYVRNVKDALGCTGQVSGAAQITILKFTLNTSVSRSSLCSGANLTVSYSLDNPNVVLQPSFRPRVLLSDANGSFGNPTQLGDGTVNNKQVNVTLPASLAPGSGYRIQIIAVNPDENLYLIPSSTPITITKADKPNVTTPASPCQGENGVTLQASGSGTINWYDSNGNRQPGAPTQTTGNPGTFGYKVSQTINGCESDKVDVSVTIKPKSSAPGTNQNITYCQNQGADVLSANGPNLVWYDASRTSLGSNAPRPNTGSAGQQKFFVSRDENGCRSDLTEITINVNALPPAPTPNAPGAICQYKDVPTLSASGQNLRWYRQENGGPSEGAIKPGSDQAGTTAFWVSQVVNNCEGPRARLEQRINDASPDPTVNSPLQLCQRQDAPTLTAQAQNPRWYNDGNNFISTDGPRPPTDQVRDITYKVSQTSNGCESRLVTLVVQIRETPGAPGVSEINACHNAPNPTLTAQGSNVLWYTAETGGNGAANPPGISTAQVGDQTYWVSQRFGTCEGPRAKLTVHVIALPSAPTPNAPGAICQYKDVPTLSASGQNLRWYRQENGGPSEGAIKPGSDQAGTTAFWVSQVVNNCEGPRARLEQRINDASPDPGTATLLLCRDQTAPSLTATGQNLRWYDGGNNFISTEAPKPPTDQVRDITYKVSQNSNGCESKLIPLLVQVRNTPGAPGVLDINVCNKAAAPTLTAQGSSLLWYTAETGGTGADNAPAVSTAQPGDQTYWVAQRFGTCEGPRAKLTVHVIALPAAPTVSTPAPICQYKDVPVLAATGQGLRWYRQETGGTAESQIKPASDPNGTTAFWVSQFVNNCEGPRSKIEQVISPASPDPVTATLLLCRDQTAPALSATGQNLRWYDGNGTFISTEAPKPPTDQVRDITYKVSQNSNGCESRLIPLAVQVRNTPGAPGVSPLSLCQNQMAQPLKATGDALAWYDQATGGTSTSSLTPQTTTLGERTYWVAQRFGTCEGPRAALLTTVYAVPPAPAATGRTYCIGDTPTALTAVGQNLRWYDGSGTAQPSIVPPTSVGQSLTYVVTQTQNACESAGQLVTVRVLNRATVRLSGDSVSVLYDSTAIRVRFTGDAPWRVQLWDGQLVTTTTSPYVKWVKPSQPGTVTYAVQSLTNDCGAGQILNTYRLIVLAPLAIDPIAVPTADLKVYPIPASQHITVEWLAAAQVSVRLQLVDATGHVSWQAERQGSGRREIERVDLATQPDGLLIVRLLAGNSQAAAIKLIKQ